MFRETTIEEYTQGGCHLLAKEILRLRPDLKAGILSHRGDAIGEAHCFVILPESESLDTLVLDVTGKQPLYKLKDEWGWLKHVSVFDSREEFEEEVSDWWAPDIPKPSVRRVAKVLLQSVGL